MPHLMHMGGGAASSQRVFLAVPTYGPVPPVFLWSLAQAQEALTRAGIGFELAILSGNCHVDDARNALVRRFLESECSDFMFLDADLGFDGEAVTKLLSYDAEAVAGIYPMKQDDEEYPCRLIPGEIWSNAQGLIEVAGVPTGFLRLRRSVLEQLALRASTYLERPDDLTPTPLIFERTLVNGTRFSGDYSFCHKYRAAGGKIYVAPELRFEHWGDHPWSGCYGAYLRKRAGLGLAGIAEVKRGNLDISVMSNLFSDWANPWAASPELLLTLGELAREAVGPIFETGAGLSTLVMAAANPEAQVFAVEHDMGWHQKLQAEIYRQQLTNITLIHAPLRNYGGFTWYDTAGIPVSQFGLALCDGPPRRLGQRKGLYELLGAQLGNAVVVSDDAVDPATTEPLESWAAKLGRIVTILPGSRPFAICPPATN